jgi:serine protease inhibitor
MAKSAYMNLETVSFTADRPFFFAVTGTGGTLLFTGVVEDPAA